MGAKLLQDRRRATVVRGLAAITLAAASIFGASAAAQAAWVPGDELLDHTPEGWNAWPYPEDVEFTQCSVVFSDGGPETDNLLQYVFPEGVPSTVDDLAAIANGLTVNMPTGSAELIITSEIESGWVDIYLPLSPGITTLTLDTEVTVDSTDPIASPNTMQGVLDALTGQDIYLFGVFIESHSSGFEVQWVTIDGETSWFGTDAEWFLNDPTCSGVTPTPPAPTAPQLVETAARG